MNHDVRTYKVNEIFYSLQGEGHHAGKAAVFVRFAKCNLHCWFCDTNFDAYTEMSAQQIIENVQQYAPCNFVVITGGEPTLQVTPELLQLFHIHGYYVSMETNGTHPIPKGVDWVTCSPKKAFIEAGNVHIKQANEIKVVYDGIHPISTFGIESEERYVQPCDVGDELRNKEIMQQAIQFVKTHPQWKLSLQLHKLIGIQ